MRVITACGIALKQSFRWCAMLAVAKHASAAVVFVLLTSVVGSHALAQEKRIAQKTEQRFSSPDICKNAANGSWQEVACKSVKLKIQNLDQRIDPNAWRDEYMWEELHAHSFPNNGCDSTKDDAITCAQKIEQQDFYHILSDLFFGVDCSRFTLTQAKPFVNVLINACAEEKSFRSYYECIASNGEAEIKKLEDCQKAATSDAKKTECKKAPVAKFLADKTAYLANKLASLKRIAQDLEITQQYCKKKGPVSVNSCGSDFFVFAYELRSFDAFKKNKTKITQTQTGLDRATILAFSENIWRCPPPTKKKDQTCDGCEKKAVPQPIDPNQKSNVEEMMNLAENAENKVYSVRTDLNANVPEVPKPDVKKAQAQSNYRDAYENLDQKEPLNEEQVKAAIDKTFEAKEKKVDAKQAEVLKKQQQDLKYMRGLLKHYLEAMAKRTDLTQDQALDEVEKNLDQALGQMFNQMAEEEKKREEKKKREEEKKQEEIELAKAIEAIKIELKLPEKPADLPPEVQAQKLSVEEQKKVEQFKPRSSAELVGVAQKGLQEFKKNPKGRIDFDWWQFIFEAHLMNYEKKLPAAEVQKLYERWIKTKNELELVAKQSQAAGKSAEDVIDDVMDRLNALGMHSYGMLTGNVIDFLQGKRVNCFAETEAHLAILMALNLPLPADSAIGLQLLPQHVQPVLVNKTNPKKPLVKNLVAGDPSVEGIEGRIFRAEKILKSFVEDQKQTSPVSDTDLLLENISPEIKKRYEQLKKTLIAKGSKLDPNLAKVKNPYSHSDLDDTMGIPSSGRIPLEATIKRTRDKKAKPKSVLAALNRHLETGGGSGNGSNNSGNNSGSGDAGKKQPNKESDFIIPGAVSADRPNIAEMAREVKQNFYNPNLQKMLKGLANLKGLKKSLDSGEITDSVITNASNAIENLTAGIVKPSIGTGIFFEDIAKAMSSLSPTEKNEFLQSIQQERETISQIYSTLSKTTTKEKFQLRQYFTGNNAVYERMIMGIETLHTINQSFDPISLPGVGLADSRGKYQKTMEEAFLSEAEVDFKHKPFQAQREKRPLLKEKAPEREKFEQKYGQVHVNDNNQEVKTSPPEGSYGQDKKNVIGDSKVKKEKHPFAGVNPGIDILGADPKSVPRQVQGVPSNKKREGYGDAKEDGSALRPESDTDPDKKAEVILSAGAYADYLLETLWKSGFSSNINFKQARLLYLSAKWGPLLTEALIEQAEFSDNFVGLFIIELADLSQSFSQTRGASANTFSGPFGSKIPQDIAEFLLIVIPKAQEIPSNKHLDLYTKTNVAAELKKIESSYKSIDEYLKILRAELKQEKERQKKK